MTGQQPKKTYKSPPGKLLKFFEKSRDSWKAKCCEAKRSLKRLKNRVRFLQQSKEQWKTRVHELEQELERINTEKQALTQEVGQLKKKWNSMNKL